MNSHVLTVWLARRALGTALSSPLLCIAARLARPCLRSCAGRRGAGPWAGRIQSIPARPNHRQAASVPSRWRQPRHPLGSVRCRPCARPRPSTCRTPARACCRLPHELALERASRGLLDCWLYRRLYWLVGGSTYRHHGGHCLFDQVYGWAFQARVIPARNNAGMPFGEQWSTDLRSVDG